MEEEQDARRRFELRVPWWAGVFVLALLMRLAYVLLADEPLAYAHPYNYFHGALSIVEHPRAWEFVLRSDAWHQWLGPWTIAPLYYLFVAAVFALLGPHLLPLQLIQCGLDSLVAVWVAILGRRFWERGGAWAGVAYALNAHAIEQCGTTLTENLHTVLLVSGVVLLMREVGRAQVAGRSQRGQVAAGGFLIGLSGLARSVSSAFVALAALWRMRQGRDSRDWRAATVLALSAACAILPWTARNVFLIGDLVPVESISVYNLWDDNSFVEGERRQAQEYAIGRQPTLAAQRAQALKLTWRGIKRNPGRLLEKTWVNLAHFVRPDGLHLLLKAEHAQPAWRHAALVVLDDGVLVPAVILFIVFVLAGRPSPARSLILLWTAYYLLMVVVVFHNEIRYRATLMPFALAGAAGGASVLADPSQRRRLRARLALGLGLVSAALMVGPYLEPAWRAVVSSRTSRAATRALAEGDLAGAERLAFQAASQDREAARPWLVQGRALAHARRPVEAMEAYERARQRKPYHWVPLLVAPRLLREAGREEEAARAAEEADQFSWRVDAWQGLEVAWRELPAPRTDEILLARNDYGAVRGFFVPRKDHRWSRHRAWVRLVPTVPAAAYAVTLEMSSPPPSPLSAPPVTVWVEQGGRARFTLGRTVVAYTFQTPAPATEELLVGIEAPTWNKAGETAEQGVRVDRVAVAPAK